MGNTQNTTLATPTLYRGYWRTIRDGVLVGISFTYNLIDGKMVNEVERKVTPQ